MGADMEKLTDNKIHELFGVNYNHILYYNFDTFAWSRNYYTNPNYNMGMAGTVLLLKTKLKTKEKLASNNLSLCAMVWMPVDDSAKWVLRGNGLYTLARPKPPVLSTVNKNIVGTIVTRNIYTKKINPVSKTWFRIIGYENTGLSKISGIEGFPRLFLDNDKFSHWMIKLQAEQR